ncbi:MAG: tetratricopeptide repeat protein [Planctomycetota bacterium]|jgi:tetratricopeptide (TPR) repeat protein
MTTHAASSLRRLMLAALVLLAGSTSPGHAQTRRVAEGELLLPFTLPGTDGRDVRVVPAEHAGTVVVFVSAHQKRSERALKTLEAIMEQVREDAAAARIVVVASNQADADTLLAEHWPAQRPTVLVDARDELRGVLGIRVTPTTIVADQRGVVAWSRAGHAFDYAVELRSTLDRMLGATPSDRAAPDTAARAEFTVNDRARRHVRAARLLAWRGDFDAAFRELDVALAFVPGDAALRLEHARLLLMADRPSEALTEARDVEATTDRDRAMRAFIAGRAHRALGNLDRARTLLEESLALQPRSPEALYELARVYEARGDVESALASYRLAIEMRLADDPPR